MPMERAVPAMIFSAPSMLVALRSTIFWVAISLTCALVSWATLTVCGVAEPLATPAAFLMSSAAGGVFVMKVNERSSYTVISTGMTFPRWDSVAALYALQNSMMLTPCWPSAGPMGGAGLAAPAWICSLIRPVTFFLGANVGSFSQYLSVDDGARPRWVAGWRPAERFTGAKQAPAERNLWATRSW